MNRVNQGVWYPLFIGLIDYLNSEKYTYNDENIVVKKMLSSTSSSKIKNDGIYFFTDTKEIISVVGLDTSDIIFTIIKQLDIGDVFYCENIAYFMNSNYDIVEKGKKWNNSYIGDYGITITIGNDDKEQLSFNTPEIVLICNGSNNIGLLERSGTNSNNKSFSFDMAVVVTESNLLNGNNKIYSSYKDLFKYTQIIEQYLFDFFESNYCVYVNEATRITDITYNSKIIETRPVIMSLYEFTVYFI